MLTATVKAATVLQPLPATSSTTPSHLSCHARIQSSACPHDDIVNPHLIGMFSSPLFSNHQNQTPYTSSQTTAPPPLVPPKRHLIIPNIAKGVDAWKQVINDWEYSDPTRSLVTPLSEWTEADLRESKMGSKYNQRKLIATEFIEMYVHPL